MPCSPRAAASALVAALALACASDATGPSDAAQPDAAAPGVDATSTDAASTDAAARDASIDAASIDAEPSDASAPLDGAAEDATPEDAGPELPYEVPIDLVAPWARSGTAVPERAALLAGCRVDVSSAAPDHVAAIDAAIARAAAQAPCAVVLSPGHFELDAGLSLPSRVSLVGAGSERTRLVFRVGEVPLVRARPPNVRPELELRGDAIGGALGETRWTVTATMATAVAAMLAAHGRLYAELSEDNDPAKFPARWAQAYAARGLGQLARVVSASGTELVLDRPLGEHYLPMTGRTKYVALRGPDRVIEGARVMDLAIERATDAHESSVSFDLCVGCSVVRVESARTGWGHVAVDRSLECLVRSSWLHGAHGHGDGGRAYGVNLRSHTTGCLVEDNAFDDLRHALIVQLGANQSVYGYNFSTNSHDDLGVTKADISGHGHYAHLVLFEGNEVELAHLSDWHGPTPRMLLFRNRVRDGIVIDDASERAWVADNVAPSLRVDPSVRRALCVENLTPQGAPIASRADCDNARKHAPRPISLYGVAPLVDAQSGRTMAQERWRAGQPVPQP